MKKTIWMIGGIVLVLGVLAVLGASAAFAQGELPPMPMRGMMGGQGWMHDYVQQALAAKLGLSVEQVQDQLASGKTMYQIALDNGIAQADLAAFMNDVHTQAFDQAVRDGAATQEQANWMLQRMQSMFQNGGGPGNCPMHNGASSNGRGMGRGMMGGPGGMWGQGGQTP